MLGDRRGSGIIGRIADNDLLKYIIRSRRRLSLGFQFFERGGIHDNYYVKLVTGFLVLLQERDEQ